MIVIEMMLPQIVAVGGTGGPDPNGDSFTPLDTTYYDNKTDLLRDEDGDPVEVLIGDGTFYQCGTEDRNEHLTRAAMVRGFRKVRIQGNLDMNLHILAIGPLASINSGDFDEEIEVSEPSSEPVSACFAVDSGEPGRTYAYQSEGFHRIAAGNGAASPTKTYVPACLKNVDGNVTMRTPILADWTLPVDDTGGGSDAGGPSFTVDSGEVAYMYPPADDPDAGTSTGTTPIRFEFTFTMYGQSVVPVRSDGGAYPVIFYVGLRIELVATDKTGPRYAGFDAMGDDGAVEDANTTPYFGSIFAETIVYGGTLTTLPPPDMDDELPGKIPDGGFQFNGDVMSGGGNLYQGPWPADPGDSISSLGLTFSEEIVRTVPAGW